MPESETAYMALARIHTLTMRRILKVLKYPQHALHYSIYMDCEQERVHFRQQVRDEQDHQLELSHDDHLFDAILQLWEHFLYEEGFEFSEAHYHFYPDAAGEWQFSFQIEPRTAG